LNTKKADTKTKKSLWNFVYCTTRSVVVVSSGRKTKNAELTILLLLLLQLAS